MEPVLPKAAPRPASQGKREQTKIQNRQIILDAARQVFAEMGYGAATVRDIIRATPLASGTFYNYFKSKEEVYQAIRDEVALTIRPRLHEARSKAATLEEFIAAGFRNYFDYVAGESENYRSLRGSEDNLRMRLDTPEVVAGFEELRDDINAAIAKGLFPPVDSDFLMAAIVGTAIEIAGRMAMRDPPNPAEAADFAYALLMGGIRALPQIALPAAPEAEAGNQSARA
jgi:AcrR family transcriptional regulator